MRAQPHPSELSELPDPIGPSGPSGPTGPTAGLAPPAGPRRRTAVLAGLVGLAGLGGATLSARGRTGPDRPATDPAAVRAPAPAAPPPGAPGGALVWAGDGGGLDTDAEGGHPSLQTFTRSTGLAVRYLPERGDDDGTTDRLVAAAGRGADVGRDVVVLGDAATARLVAEGGAHALEPGRLPGLAAVLPALRSWAGDPGCGWSLPWRSSYVGLVWDTRRVDVSLAAAADLWRSDLRGRVVLPRDWHDGLGVLAMAAGVRVDGPVRDVQDGLREALGEVQRHRLGGRLLAVADPLEALLRGRAVAGVARSADVQRLQQRAPGRFSFVVPDAGALLVGDHLVVPRGTSRIDDVLRLLDHYLQPAAAAAVSLTVPGLCPVRGAREVMARLDARRAASPLVFPTDADLARCQVLTPPGDPDERQFAGAYARVTGP